jgi:DNA-binding HxlR family transcriptional regulator
MVKERLKEMETRSKCPVSCTLELIGDKWSLLIIRDMMFFEKSTYNEFLNSGEKISTNILNDRLLMLTEMGIINYSGSSKRKKYALTAIGRDLKPIIESIAEFGMKHFEGSGEYTRKQLKDDKG